jgi:DNA-binding CsgD family transcriptional regulator
MEERLAGHGHADEMAPPHPSVLPEAIWVVFRIDEAAVSKFVPSGLVVARPMIGVLGIYVCSSGPPFAPYARTFTGVTVDGYDSPDRKDAVFIVADTATAGADTVIRRYFSDACFAADTRLWWEDGLLHGSVSSDGREWLKAVSRPTGPAQPGVTGADGYLGFAETGLERHLVSYLGGVRPAEVVDFSVGDNAPAAFQAMRPTEIILGTIVERLHTTWGEPLPIAIERPGGGTPRPAELTDLLRAVGLTTAEARLAALIGTGKSAKAAALELNISENTARSALKQVYGKLGIRKQSELGHLVARLQFH